LPSLLLCWQAWNLCPPAPLTSTAESPQRDAGPEDALEDEPQDDLLEEFLGALGALGGSAGNGRLREVLEWEEATFEGVKAQLLSRGLIVPGRGRGGSVVLAAGRGGPASEAPAGPVPARRSRAGKASGATTASAFDQAFRAIDDCLRKEAGCGTELDYTEQTVLTLTVVAILDARRVLSGYGGGWVDSLLWPAAIPMKPPPAAGIQENCRPFILSSLVPIAP
jgi:hypothetical protein